MDTSWIEEVVYEMLKEQLKKASEGAEDVNYDLKDGRNNAMLITVDAADGFEVYKLSIERLV